MANARGTNPQANKAAIAANKAAIAKQDKRIDELVRQVSDIRDDLKPMASMEKMLKSLVDGPAARSTRPHAIEYSSRKLDIDYPKICFPNPWVSIGMMGSWLWPTWYAAPCEYGATHRACPCDGTD